MKPGIAPAGEVRLTAQPERGWQRLVTVTTWIILAVLLTSVDMALQHRTAIETLGETGEGSRIRQIVYIVTMLCALGLVARRHSFGGLARLFPISLLVLFCWAAITLLWSPVPEIGGRRLVLTFITATTVLSLACLQSAEELVRRFRQVVVILALVSLALVIVAPELAIHQPNDPESLIVGDWRGVFYHKNIFGAVLAPAVLITFHERLTRPRHERGPAGLTLLFLLVMLWMTGSKTALGLSVLLMGLLWTMILASRRRGGLVLFGCAVYVAALVVLAGIVLWLNHSGRESLIDDGAFTGRGYIWGALLQMAEGRMLFGLGYQSVFQIGHESPLTALFAERFFLTLSHAHSAYLEILISTGWIGLVLFVVALIGRPLQRVFRLPSEPAQTRLLLLTLMILTWLHGLLESGLFDRDRTMWIVFLLAYGALRQLPIRRGVPHGS